MKIALISVHTGDVFQSMPLGIGSIKAYLKSKDSELEIQLLHFRLGVNVDDVLPQIHDAEIVGFSMYLWNRAFFDELFLKMQKTDKVLVAGGPEIVKGNFFHEDSVIQITGAGELAFYSVVQAVKQGKGFEDIQKAVNADLTDRSVIIDGLPSPFLTGVIRPGEYPGVLWELSRGCPFKCAFCFESLGSDSVERLDLERIEAELKLFVEQGVCQVWVLDPTFNYDLERAKQILELIEAIAPEIYFNFEIRAEYIDAELAALLSRLYCSVQIGLQSSSKKILKNINRSFNPQVFKENILHLHENHVVYGLDLIYGLPGDSIDGFKNSIEYALELAPNHLDVFPLSVLPGTSLREKAEMYSLEYLRSVPYDLIENPGFNLEEGHLLKEAVDLFYNRGKAVSWFVQLVHALNIKPIEVIEKFASFIKPKPQAFKAYKQSGDITRLIIAFLRDEISDAKLFAIVSDIIQYFTYTSELMENITSKTAFRIAEYETDIETLLAWLDSGFTDFKKLVKKVKPMKQNMLYWAHQDDSGVFAITDSLASVVKKDLKKQQSILLSAGDAKVFGQLQKVGLFTNIKYSIKSNKANQSRRQSGRKFNRKKKN